MNNPRKTAQSVTLRTKGDNKPRRKPAADPQMTQSATASIATVKQLNIRLPVNLHRELKAKCAIDGLPIVDAIERLVSSYLAGKVKLD